MAEEKIARIRTEGDTPGPHAAPGAESPSHHDVNTPLLVTIGVVASIIIVVIIIGLQAFFYRYEQKEISQYEMQPVMSLENQRLAQETKINTYHWIDPAKQIAAIPIDDAMRIMIQTQGRFPTTQPTTNPSARMK